MKKIINEAIQLIQEGRWFEAIILIFIMILMFGGVIHFVSWWHTGRWESKGPCSFCKGVGTVVRGEGRIDKCPQCRGTGKPYKPY